MLWNWRKLFSDFYVNVLLEANLGVSMLSLPWCHEHFISKDSVSQTTFLSSFKLLQHQRDIHKVWGQKICSAIMIKNTLQIYLKYVYERQTQWVRDKKREKLYETFIYISSVQLLSHVRLFATSWTAALQVSLSITNSQSLPKLMSIESVMPSNHLILCHPLLLPPSIFPRIRVFSNASVLCIRWPEYWSFSFNISPSNEHSGLISFRIDWLDILSVQKTLKSFLQHHNSKASILHSAFIIVQLSHPYTTIG